MGWIRDYFKQMWNQGAEQGKAMKNRDAEKAKNIVKKIKGGKKND